MDAMSSPFCDNDLNPSQLRAVSHCGHHLLIVAGPGTGKTHTITHRMIELGAELNSNQKILAITFTNKAAREMRERLLSRWPAGIDRISVGTFHSFCLEFLREHGALVGLPEDFRVASSDEIDALAVVLWPDQKAGERQETLERISRWKSTGQDFRASPPTHQNLFPLSYSVETFNKALRERKLLDFDDLLLETWKILLSDDQLRLRTQRRYPYVFVDEYQDINAVQHALLKVLVQGNDSPSNVFITAIGDPNQAIYGFRGADVRFFASFPKDFPDAEVFHLTDNYRSAPNLLKASGQIIQNKAGAFDVPELTAKIYTQGHLIVHASPTDRAEAEFVVHQIEQLIGGTSFFSHDSKRVKSSADVGEGTHSFGDIAVLYRLNMQSRILEEAFARSGIPFQIAGRTLLSTPGVSEILTGMKDCAAQSPQLTTSEIFQLWKESSSGMKFLSSGPTKQEVFEKLYRFSLSSESNNWLEFLDYLSLARPEDELESRTEKVSLMTLHASKGLEFPVVFIIGCEENLLPLQLPGLSSDANEERRLFYVGMTRSKERLYFTHARRRYIFGQEYENKISAFVQDIEYQLKSFDQSDQKRYLKNSSVEKQWELFSS